ncbi:hypothetical protein P175DRAFT_0534808 [Aspergillus ochraceoroseus IBT 24754]|uniref:Uncharacterized protein n=1 Tax=Aspergillus ochraceoroseus IBT 24754 TaxID=1392256 RepID=A0A2T5LRW3_9EURO|nr:uncharacterized protein P175DRAFT_0534808 [Aspergillus ochraceoroseus IBT 24754]PTU19020.1 hypothetical protein P175DRAFT_0534808 [Aspergillus ochraceoroseus IBT 24754]
MKKGFLLRSTVVVLHELPSSVDIKADQIMQAIIRKEFHGVTVVPLSQWSIV